MATREDIRTSTKEMRHQPHLWPSMGACGHPAGYHPSPHPGPPPSQHLETDERENSLLIHSPQPTPPSLATTLLPQPQYTQPLPHAPHPMSQPHNRRMTPLRRRRPRGRRPMPPLRRRRRLVHVRVVRPLLAATKPTTTTTVDSGGRRRRNHLRAAGTQVGEVRLRGLRGRIVRSGAGAVGVPAAAAFPRRCPSGLAGRYLRKGAEERAPVVSRGFFG